MPRPAPTSRKNLHASRQHERENQKERSKDKEQDGNANSGRKQITKQKSAGHLRLSNGSVNGTAASASAIVPPVAAVSGCDYHHPPQDVKAEETDKMNGCRAAPGSILGGGVDKSGPPKKSTTNNPFSLASTIVKSCPMYDTIAILIFLLQLPPIVLTLVQFLFASLTFMPPAGISTSALTSNFDIFQGPAGTPSLGTMIAMDAFCLLVWGLFMWTWAQNFAIDLAQVQVAITLGGGSSGKNGSVNALCVLLVLAVHLLRSQGIQDFVIGRLLAAKLISTDTIAKYSSLVPHEFRRKGTSSPTWLRSLLAVHILAQAGTAMARRSMARNRSAPPSKHGKRTDPEASAGSQPIDSAFESAASVSSSLPEGIHAPSAMKESRDRIYSAKKRRRQANQIRSRQPFWAALASTKVTVMRVRESENARNGTWTATTTHPLTEDDFDRSSSEEIWITQIDSSSIHFAASDFTVDLEHSPTVEDFETKPFYVYVNGAPWATVRTTVATANTPETSLVRWRGEIFGLAPDCAYNCAFFRRDTSAKVCVMSVKTPCAPEANEANVPAIPPSRRPSLRPSSPATTMRNSVNALETKLNDRRFRLRKSKNDHKIHISKVKKEVDSYNNRLKSGNDENRQLQRTRQLQLTIAQTKEASSGLDSQLERNENAPDEELEEWASCKAEFERWIEELQLLKSELEEARASAGRSISSAQSELSSSSQKCERLKARHQRLAEQLDRITAANAQGLNERERRVDEQLAKERERVRIEETFHEQLTSITRSIQDYQSRATQLWHQASMVEQAFQRQQQQQQQQQLMYLQSTAPLTPEGELPGTTRSPDLSVSTNSAAVSRPSLSVPSSKAFNVTSLSPTAASPFAPTADQLFPPSPLTTTNPFLADVDHFRQTPLSSFSNRNGQPQPDGASAVGYFIGSFPDADRRANSAANPSPRAGSRNSGGSGSASMSGSGESASASGSPAGSPHSPRQK